MSTTDLSAPHDRYDDGESGEEAPPTERAAEVDDWPHLIRSGPVIGRSHAALRIDEAGNFVASTRGTPRGFAATLRILADEIEQEMS